MAESTVIQRPRRWDNPLDPDMPDSKVDQILGLPPICDMNPDKFPSSAPLRDIIRNDMRSLSFKKGDIIIRQGDYGTSAYIVISGEARIIPPPGLPQTMLGRAEIKRKGIFEAISQLWANAPMPEARDPGLYSGGRTQMDADEVQANIPDSDTVLAGRNTITIGPGQMFGEIAALTRSARTTSIIADGDMEILEMRRSGIRDLRRCDDGFRVKLDTLYRQNNLITHLQQTPLFKNVVEKLDDAALSDIANKILFETFGDFDWHISYSRIVQQSMVERLAHEPKIASEGDYPDGLLMIRSGFARVSHKINNGEKTVRYIGAGAVFGFEEIAHNWRHKDDGDFEATVLQYTLRAVGYTNILRVPTSIVEALILPNIPPELTPGRVERRHQDRPRPLERRSGGRRADDGGIDEDILESLVENRIINGTATMLIDLDRCIRCDACVQARATGHNNNPRFIRHGRKMDHFMVANACMHCADPVCMIGCPTGAIDRNEQSGEVVINDITCIGCTTCASNCPYDNIRMVEIRDQSGAFIVDEVTGTPIVKATKCDLCIDQLGGPPVSAPARTMRCDGPI